jgi:hypothetical protein
MLLDGALKVCRPDSFEVAAKEGCNGHISRHIAGRPDGEHDWPMVEACVAEHLSCCSHPCNVTVVKAIASVIRVRAETKTAVGAECVAGWQVPKPSSLRQRPPRRQEGTAPVPTIVRPVGIKIQVN